jgi:integrase
LRSGKDPIDEAAAQRRARESEATKALTFEECATQWFRQNESRWRHPKVRAARWAGMKRWVFPLVGNLLVRAVDTAAILRVLEQKVDAGSFWSQRTETADKMRGLTKDILDWAKVRGYRDGDNPAAWTGNLKQVLPSQAKVAPVVNMPALHYSALPAFMVDLRARPALAARCLEFTIATASRTSEVLGAKWREIDLDKAVWVVPAERMKQRREHRVPLSKQAVALLRSLPREKGNPFVFIGGATGKPLSNMSMLTLLRRMGRDDITVHGFRSTFRDYAEECTQFGGTVAEAALAHLVGDKTEAAYRRGDLFQKRAKLMQAWATYCSTSGSNVVRLQAAQ